MNASTATSPTIEGIPERTGKEKFRIWFHQNRFLVLGLASALIQGILVLTVYFPDVRFDEDDEVYDEIAFTANVQLKEAAPEVPPAEGEIKETERLKKEVVEDTRIASAANPFAQGATAPVDLNPGVKPPYTAEARAAGIEGVVVLELIISEKGNVLRARVLRGLGYGLDQSAVRTFRAKKFTPSYKEGKPITVKIPVQVRFTLY